MLTPTSDSIGMTHVKKLAPNRMQLFGTSFWYKFLEETLFFT